MSPAYTHQQTSLSARNVLDAAKDGAKFHMTLGIEKLDAVITPLLPCRLYGILACTGEAKTFTLNYLAYMAAQQLKSADIKDRFVVHVGSEESVEESTVNYVKSMGEDINFADMESGKADLDKVSYSLSRHGGAKMVYMGPVMDEYFLNGTHDGASSLSSVSVADILSSVGDMEEKIHMKPAVIFIDYVQLLRPANPSQEKFLQVEQIVHDCKTLSIQFKCPVVIAIQAKQDVKQRNIKIPNVYDAQHSSAIAQTLDGCISLWMPVADIPGENKLWQNIPVTSNLIIAQVVKWRYCAGRGKTFALKADFTHNALEYVGAINISYG